MLDPDNWTQYLFDPTYYDSATVPFWNLYITDWVISMSMALILFLLVIVGAACSPPVCRRLIGRWIAVCAVRRWFRGVLFPSLRCCHVIVGVLFPVSVSRLPCQASHGPRLWGGPGETVSCCRCNRVQPGLNGHHVGLLGDETKELLESWLHCLSWIFFFFLKVRRNGPNNPDFPFGDATSQRWVTSCCMWGKKKVCLVVREWKSLCSFYLMLLSFSLQQLQFF